MQQQRRGRSVRFSSIQPAACSPSSEMPKTHDELLIQKSGEADQRPAGYAIFLSATSLTGFDKPTTHLATRKSRRLCRGRACLNHITLSLALLPKPAGLLPCCTWSSTMVLFWCAAYKGPRQLPFVLRGCTADKMQASKHFHKFQEVSIT